MKLNRVTYLIGEGLRGVFSHGFRSFASVTIIVACLIIMGSFSLLSLNVDAVIEDLEQESEVLAFVTDDYTDDQARSIEPVVAAVPNVREVKFVSREEAMENYKGQYTDDEAALFSDIDSSVFRNRYVVYLNDIVLMDSTRDALMNVEGIADVNAYVDLASGFVTARNVVSAVTVILIVILLIVSLFIMSNTIKLATFTRREEIAIMKMVGAGNWFIRLPFIVEGIMLGLLGGVIAFFLEWSIYKFTAGKVMSTIAGELFRVIPFSEVSGMLLAVYLGAGILVGAFGGTLAIRNYLKV